MNWYSCHVVMSVRFKEGPQNHFPVMENVFLVEASTAEDALNKAESIGLNAEGDDSGTFTWEGRPARWVFAGLRKCVAVVHPTKTSNEPSDGAELTYLELDFDSEAMLKAFVEGDDAQAKISA